jgi:hypothetical protein
LQLWHASYLLYLGYV